jgi:hypothetical protein
VHLLSSPGACAASGSLAYLGTMVQTVDTQTEESGKDCIEEQLERTQVILSFVAKAFYLVERIVNSFLAHQGFEFREGL